MTRSLALLAVALSFARAAIPIPTPESHFHHPIGVDRVLLDWDQVVSYFQKLGKSSPLIQVQEIGKTAEGRPFIAAIISDRENMRNLPRLMEVQRRLADPRITSATEAEKLILQAKNIVMITCSIHATEVASTHTAVEFAYKLLTDESPRFRAIRKDTVVILIPSQNPDGVDIVTRWYRKTLGTPFEGTSPPELYHHYVGHDNNRDWYIFSQPETRNTVQLFNKWHPEIWYDVHQQGTTASRIFVPPWLDPIEPNIDPIIVQEMNMIGTSVASDLTASGKVGVAIHAAYDFWTPARHYQAFHGGLRILTESASAKLATPITIKPEQLDTHPLGYNAQQSSWNFLQPWGGGTWHLRDIIEYQLTAFESLLYNAAIHHDDMARNYFTVAQHQVLRTSPYAFVIPAEQRDSGATRRLFETLQFGGVEIERAANGDHVISMQQPYSGWAKALLERQHYPDLRMYPGGPPQRPYDTTAETLPLLFGVDVKTVDMLPTESLQKESFPFDAPAPAAYKASDTDSWRTANAAWKSGRPVWRDERTGDFSPSDNGAGWKRISAPRVALFRSYSPAMDEGWTRWLLEKFGFAFQDVSVTDVQTGSLQRKFDVIIFPDQPPASITNGFKAASMPPDVSGGLGDRGIAAVKQFVNAGGTVLCFNHSTAFCIGSLGAEATNALSRHVAAAGGDEPDSDVSAPSGRNGGGFYSPGSLLNVKLNRDSPLTRGLPEEIAIWSEQSPAFTTAQEVVAKYPATEILASGWLLGADLLANQAALVDARVGNGHVILFGMRPQYRAQSYQAFKLFFNALIAYAGTGSPSAPR